MVSASPFHQRRVRGAVPHTYGTSFRRYPSSRVVWRAWNIEISSFGGQSPPTSLVHFLMVLQRSHNDGLRHRETEARKACCTVLYEPPFLLYSQNNLMIVRTQVAAVALRAFRYIPIAKESGVVHLSLHTGPPPRPTNMRARQYDDHGNPFHSPAPALQTASPRSSCPGTSPDFAVQRSVRARTSPQGRIGNPITTPTAADTSLNPHTGRH